MRNNELIIDVLCDKLRKLEAEHMELIDHFAVATEDLHEARKNSGVHDTLYNEMKDHKEEIKMLENNLGFFQHVDDDNPLVKDVNKKIGRHTEKISILKYMIALYDNEGEYFSVLEDFDNQKQ